MTFSIEKLFMENLNLYPNTEHPLPWFPPTCRLFKPEVQFNLDCCDHLLGVQIARNQPRLQMPKEPSFDVILKEMAKSGSPVDAEVGQRLNTMYRYDIGPKWLVLILTSMYWRLQGVPFETVQCLRLALNETGVKPHADMALVPLAYLLHWNYQRDDDAITLLKHALEVDPKMVKNVRIRIRGYRVGRLGVTGGFNSPRTKNYENLLSLLSQRRTIFSDICWQNRKNTMKLRLISLPR